MPFQSYQSVADALLALRQEGFTIRLQFNLQQLQETRSPRRYHAKDCLLLKYFRIPPGKLPGNSRSVYAIQLPDGRKAVVISNVRRRDDFQLALFMDKMNVAIRAAS